MEEEKDEGNVYAYNIEGKIIHISEAGSGKLGYFCLGCEREMQAVQYKIVNHQSYFRHDPKGVEPNKKCTFSDETHRHNLAKAILQQIKKIKVPPVYKYPPRGQDGLATLLIEDRYIEAHTVENETCFFEDENGELKWGKQKDVGDRFLLIQPDVTFFDKDYKPILFIELVATHKVSLEKQVKIRRLGIDTIFVNIPKDSPEQIEKTFYKSEKTKWVFNNEQERADYLPVSYPDAMGVPPIDELQRKLFEESFECRAAQIRSFIRGINKCLASQPYRDIESGFRDAISRVEGNTADNRERLLRLQEKHRAEISSKYSEKGAEIANEKEQIRFEKEEFRANAIATESDFREKTARLDKETTDLEGETRILGLRIEEEITALGRSNGESEREAAIVDRDIERARYKIIQLQADTDELPERFEELTKSARQRFEEDSNGERAEISGIQEAGEQLPARFEQERGELEERFINLREQSDSAVKARITIGDTELSRRIKKILDSGRTLRNFETGIISFKRNKRALECFNQGTFKNWIR
ncbi:hypothetical protein [Adhaeribacter aquaticus]|uniref:hypothetical protein n=1 Tax=Adhaeribacter aquaticus TaxID=299567 RepID=UPI000401ABE2|nr:hypothetical protein [Adhaeribacter aquaticus]